MYTNIHCIVIYNSQDMEAIVASLDVHWQMNG